MASPILQWFGIPEFHHEKRSFADPIRNAADVVILAGELGKKYLLGHTAEFGWHFTFRDMLIRGDHDLWRKATDMMQG